MSKIISIEISNQKAFKCPARKRFVIDSVLTTEDGEKTNYQITSEKKRDLPAAVERFEKCVAVGVVTLENGFVFCRYVSEDNLKKAYAEKMLSISASNQ